MSTKLIVLSFFYKIFLKIVLKSILLGFVWEFIRNEMEWNRIEWS